MGSLARSKRAPAIALLLGALAPHSGLAQEASAAEVAARFTGHYELVRYEVYRANGEVVDMDYVGRIHYDGHGNMSAIGMPRDLPERARRSEDNVQAGFAYWGRVSFDVDRGIVLHHVEGSPTRGSWPGVDNVRDYEFPDDGLLRLSLRNAEGRTTASLTWRKIRPQPAPSIEYIAHASFIVESSRGSRLLIDPYADEVWLGYRFPTDLEYDAVAITHPHYDHDGGEYRGLPTPWPEGTPVYRDAGLARVGDMRLIGIDAKHADPYGMEFGQKNVVWVVEVDGLRLAHIGDNGPLTASVIRAMGQIDVLFLPIDAEEHILSYDAIDDILAAVQPHVVVPMHYRLAELEPGDGPDDLGPIDPWLERRASVVRLDTNFWWLTDVDDLATGTVVVFEPSPSVPR